MIALDTNVLARYLTDDDDLQSAIARRFIEETLTPARPGFVGLIVLVELAWVLRSSYGASRARVAEVVLGLLGSAQLVVEQAQIVERAAKMPNADLADSLLLEVGRANGCSRTVTFDRAFSTFENVGLLS